MKKFALILLSLILNSSINLAQQEWYYLNPKPNAGNYRAASFTDNNNGTVVGQKGIIRTTDGGNSWKWQIFNKPRELRSVSFVDVNNGWAVGQSGTIISTTDAGDTWIEQVSGSTQTLYSVHFIDLYNGIAVGSGGTVRRTTDGGNTWNTLNIVGSSVLLTGVYFSDINNITIVGSQGTIRRSTDGGNNWGSQSSGTTVTFKAVHFVDANVGTIVGLGGTIRRTTDGGNNWIVQSAGTAGGFESVSFIDANNGLIVGPQNTYYKTSDGGDNWISNPIAISNGLAAIFINTNDAFIIGNYEILKTNNGGSDWTNHYKIEDEFNFNSRIGGLHIFDETSFATIHNVAGQHLFYRTSDNGANWSSYYFNGVTGEILDMHFESENFGVLCGTVGNIYVTYDGGSSWISKSISSTITLNSVSFGSVQFGTVVGSGGNIYRTTDTGQTWFSQTSGTTSSLNSVYFINDNVGTAVGNNSTILRTTNGGANWFPQTSPIPSLTFYDISFVDTENGIIVGSNGNTLRTTDGGANWIASNVGYPMSIWAITQTDINHATIVGYITTGPLLGAGYILSTTDAGYSWEMQRLSGAGLTDIKSLSSSNIITVGQNGEILKGSEFMVPVNRPPLFVSPTPSGGTLFTIDVDHPFTFTVAAEDIDAGDVVSLSVIGLPSGSAMNPVLPVAGNPVSSNFSWTPDLARVGNYTVTYEITDGNSTPVSCSFNIEVINDNVVPTFVEPTPVCGSPLTAYVGSVFTFTVSAQDGDATDIISLTSGTLPTGSAMNPVLPISGNPVSSDFSWTPDLASVGNHTLTFEITDGYSVPVTCSFDIEVINSNVAPVFTEPTPASGSTLTVYAGSPIIFTVRAEDSDAGNIVELFVAGLPLGSSMNPPLPFAANPVSSEFSWTPTSADVGTYELICTAVDNFTASATCTLTVIVAEVPAVVCPLNQLFWKDNPALWPVETLVLGTLHSYDKARLLTILGSTDLRDASVILAKQLIATKLNVANGAPVPVEVADMIVNSDRSIDKLVIPAGIRPISILGLTMLRQAITLLAYNNNLLTLGCSSTLAKQMAIEEEILIPVSDYSLFDNYPNPFNPTTRIMYSVPNNEFVTLKVFNTIGEEVMTLVNEVKQPGLYEVEFISNGLPSGVYLYRIVAGDFVATKKMILMK